MPSDESTCAGREGRAAPPKVRVRVTLGGLLWALGPASGGSKREGEKRARSARWAGHKRASQAAPAIGWNPNRASLCSIFEAGSLVRVPGAPARRPQQSAWPLTYASCKTTHEIGGVGRRLEGARVGRPRPGHPGTACPIDGDGRNPKGRPAEGGYGGRPDGKRAKHTTAGIRTWSPTVLLVRRFAA